MPTRIDMSSTVLALVLVQALVLALALGEVQAPRRQWWCP